MVKNVKRYQKQVKREGGSVAAQESADIIPATFVLPQDYALFVEEFRRQPAATWIMKPSSKSQGKGIFLINKLSQVKKWSSCNSLPPALRHSQDSYVISRYIDNPLLIGGKKFDLRLYVVVTSYRPLTAYLSNLGFGRFCSEKYTTEEAELDNDYVHLTNVSIQRNCEEYNSRHGHKWTLDSLRLYMEATHGVEASDKLFQDIEACVVKSLRAVCNIIINDKHCFELYGYDMLIDDNLKPWLVEVNASPSLAATSPSDRLLKFKVISDTLNLVTPYDWLASTHMESMPKDLLNSNKLSRRGRPQRMGSFHLIHDEQAELEAIRCQQRSTREAGENGGVSTGGAWYAAGASNGRGAGSSSYSSGGVGRRPLSAQRPRSAGPVA
ncbi:tubulin tyrosine ligase [Dunaliella salina]|uniref:Tubulin tyrosine ligase n=1 Tax=Dunaliella salina TaxID=3046 RepID=A0ABQ7G245_DUNSA|nr:tubulin tyrosine ligase [Dunaliella salina]|eukprot:KAF5828673.1 tubulin tyrosine ligase [Dunaliella salina]